jgi:hypothetical protein
MQPARLIALHGQDPDWHGQFQYGRRQVPDGEGKSHFYRKAKPPPREGRLCPVCHVRVGAAGEACCSA